MKKKTLTLMIAVVLVLCCIVGGTLAWLTDKTESVTNTFTTSDVDIELAETEGGDTHEFKMVPGYTVTKDPKVTVKANSEKAYVFVKLVKSENFDTYMTYTVDTTENGWTELTEVSGVYYRVVEASTEAQDFAVIKDNKVAVSDKVTKAQMNVLIKDNYPTLTVTAYACQYMKNNTESFTPAEAWNNASEQQQ